MHDRAGQEKEWRAGHDADRFREDTLRLRFSKLIDGLEQAPLHWGYSLATFLGIVAIRNLLEGALGPKGAIGFSYFASPSALMVLDHFVFFYATLFLAISILLSALARRPIGAVIKVVTPAWLLILIPPFLDYVISSGQGVRITYVSDLGNVILRFFDPGSSLERISPGQRVEILAACLLGAAYVRVRTRSWLRSAGAFVGIYLLLAAAGFLPSAYARLSWLLAGERAAPATLIYDMTYKAGGIVPDESRKLALLFLLTTTALGCWAYARHAPSKFRAMLRGLRSLRSTHYVGLTVFGAALAYAIFARVGVRLAGGGDALGVAGLVLATFLAFQSSAAVNDILDVEADRIAGNPRPLATNELSRSDVVGQAVVLGAAALLFALNVKYAVLLALVLVYAVSLLYSMPPLRLKRVPLLSTLTLGFISFLTCVVGFTAFAEERAFALFPARLGWLIVLSFGLGFAAKDLKDVDGDRATGVFTLPVILGPAAGRVAVAVLVFAGYALAPVLLPMRVLIAPAVVLGLWSAVMVFRWKRPGLDRILLAACLAFTVFVAVVTLMNVAEVADVTPEVVAGKASEFLARRAQAMYDWPTAAVGFGRAAAEFPEMPDLQRLTGMALYESGRAEDAIAFLDRAVLADPSSPVSREYISAALSAAGRPDVAEMTIMDAVTRNVRPRIFLSLLGEIRMSGNDLDGAASALRAALSLGQPDVPTRLRLAEAYMNSGKMLSARQELEDVLSRHPSSAQAHDAYGKFLNARGEYGRAATAFERAIDIDPGEAVFWNNLGVALRLKGDYEQALEALDAATKLAPRSPDPYFNRGEIARAVGREDEARRQYLLALELDPSFTPARAALEGDLLLH